MSHFKLYCAVLALLSLLVVSHPASAQRNKQLTDADVRKFVEISTMMTTGESKNDHGKIKDFFEKHLTKDARFRSTIKYIVPGFPPRETAMALDKKGFIENIIKGAESFEDHQSNINIKNVQIVSNGTQAIVNTEGRERGVMLVPVGETGEVERVPVDGYTKCNQIVRLSKQGVIQIYNAVCDTMIEFVPDF